MAADFLELLVRANLAGGAAILAVLALRTPVARRFGPRRLCLWLAVPLAALASLLPARRVVVVVEPGLPAPPPAFEPALGALDAAPRALALAGAPLDAGPPLFALWLAGAAAFLGLLVWRQLRFGRALGRHLAAHPQYRNAARLSADLLPSGWNEAAQRRLRDRIAADFRAGRLFVHRGWRLSDTEGRLFALAALSEG